MIAINARNIPLSDEKYFIFTSGLVVALTSSQGIFIKTILLSIETPCGLQSSA